MVESHVIVGRAKGMGVEPAEPNQVIWPIGLLEVRPRIIDNHAHSRGIVGLLGVKFSAERVDFRINLGTIPFFYTVAQGSRCVVAGTGTDNQNTVGVRLEAEGNVIVVLVHLFSGKGFW